MSTRSPASRPPRPGQKPQPGGRNRTPLVIGAVVVLVLAALLVAVLVGGDDDEKTSTGGSTPATAESGDSGSAAPAGDVTVQGTPLPQLADSGDDDAVGKTVPTIEGTDLEGNPITIAPNGRPQMIVVLAHWCPHCQAEVPVLVEWVADGGLPEDVEMVGIATANSPQRPNYPARDWLDREEWDAPTLLDDDSQNAAIAVGTSAYPFMVVTDADGKVVARTSGELTTDQLSDLVAKAEGS